MSKNELSDANAWFDIRFKQLFKEEIVKGGYIKTWIAIVDSYNSTNSTANVHLPSDTVNIIPNVKNKSGATLSIGNVVELHSRLSSLGNCYIAVKY